MIKNEDSALTRVNRRPECLFVTQFGSVPARLSFQLCAMNDRSIADITGHFRTERFLLIRAAPRLVHDWLFSKAMRFQETQIRPEIFRRRFWDVL